VLVGGVAIALGYLLGGGVAIVPIAIVLAIGLAWSSYFYSDKIALAMYSAQRVSESENADVYRRLAPVVQGLTLRMGLPMPKLFVIPEESPNAFATGRNPAHASVAVTSGILRIMDDHELEGVLAHELGHVKNRDILTSSVAATLAAAITVVARMFFWFGGSRDDDDRGGGLGGLLILILAPIGAAIIQMMISRTREYAADASSAQYTGTPFPLISALQKLETASKQVPMEASPATAHMFIIKPFTGQSIMRLFSTHPSTADRIERLREMAVPKPI
jgi:heat shock protein HtpX